MRDPADNLGLPRMNATPPTTAARLFQLTALRPRLALVLGSGFQGVLDAVEVVDEVPYARLPGFPQPTVAGHGGKLVAGKLAGRAVLLLCGRAHFYEGHSLDAVTFAVRVLAAFGIRDLVLTNAAGGINRRFRAGDFMRLTDHLNFMGANPLRGPVPDGLTRFVDLSQTYDVHLGKLLQQAARSVRVPLRSGIYLAVSGPSYETPAEIRAFARWGADAVGMSTVPEAIVARQCGLAVAGLSCITNLAAGRSATPLSHDEVLAAAAGAGPRASRLLTRFVELYDQG